MSIDEQMQALQAISSDFINASADQRRAANDAIREIGEKKIAEALNNMIGRTAELQSLAGRLQSVVDDIKANRITQAMDNFSSFVTDAEETPE